MFVLEKNKKKIIKALKDKSGIEIKVSDLMLPPKRELGDFSLPLFSLAKNPHELALKIVDDLKDLDGITVKEAGPYVNFTFDYDLIGKDVLEESLSFDDSHVFSNKGKGKKVVIEFGQPNTMKAFHIGHFRNITTGESLVRLFEALGYEVVRANYQGDIGPHVAKSLWGVLNMDEEYERVKKLGNKEKAEFLGKAYAYASQQYEEKEEIKKEIQNINKDLYNILEGAKDDSNIHELYKETRQWSLDYFEDIYQKLDSHFDKNYFESDTFSLGKKLVLKNTGTVFEKSQDAVIYPGEKQGLHNRVFITSEGNATYEAKDLALAYKKYEDFQPDFLVVVTGKEQSEYFKILFLAMDEILPELKNKKKHIGYGFVQLKEGKMSSRLGKVITFEDLFSDVSKALSEISESDKDREVIAVSAMKYAMLKSAASSDIAFDVKSTVSVSGQSGPYLLYTYVRLKKILEKSDGFGDYSVSSLTQKERDIIFKLASFGDTVVQATLSYDPSKISHYVFDLCQIVNEYYQETQILNSNNEKMRLALIKATMNVIGQGLRLLGIKKVDTM